ncbi:C-type lectin domain 4 [Mactra antiquata]
MLCVFLILLSTFSAATCVCQDDWLRYHESCYYFADLPHHRVSWNQAMQECTWKGSHLVTIETEEENNFLIRHLQQLHMDRGTQFWTNGNDLHYEGAWNWGLVRNPITRAFWHNGEPNSAGTGEDCLSLHLVDYYAWNDEGCHELVYFICETEDPANSGSIIG